MRLALAVAALMLVGGSAPGKAEEAGERYAASYTLSGFLLRASVVCPGNKRLMIQRAFIPVSSQEFKVFAKAYPSTIQKWMGDGAALFNTGVMQDGINEACRRAKT